ncbi:MAG TPA: papain-like cysteine protease family protein [Hyalangium sp.]|nr:papain-like cysteine protease family protein [Hyalangium sp.]
MKNLIRSALVFLMTAASVASAGSLPVPLEPQQTSMWCWAASGSMIMHYLGASRVTQCDEANRRFNRTDCCNSPTPSACVVGGWPEFQKYGFTFNTTNNTALSWSSLVSEINANRPVAFSWGWTGGGGHMMVAKGYTVTRTDNLVDVNDPWAPNVGDTYFISYSEYVSGSDHVHWDDYYNIRNSPPCSRDFHDLPASSFQGCFDYWAWRDRWPVTLAAYTPSSTTLMAGSFQNVNSRPVRTLMTGAQFQSYFNTYSAQGWRPEQINVLSTSNGPRFTVIWTPVDGQFQTHFGLTEAQMSAKFSELWNAGYLQVDMAVYEDNGIKFASTWVKKAHSGYATYWGMTQASYNQKFSDFASQGLRPVRFSAYPTANGTRYAAIWHPAATGFIHYYNMTSATYQSTYNDVAGMGAGFKLSQLNALDDRISAIWTK